MKTTLAIFLSSFCLTLAAEPQLFVEGSFHDHDKTVGWFRQVCVDKKAAEQLCAKYTNSVSGIAPGLDVRARVHTCNHDLSPVKSCTTELISKLEPDLSNAETNFAIHVTQVVTLEKRSLKDNVPQFRVPCVKGAAEKTLIDKIKAEEFAGKNVTTNSGTSTLSAEDAKGSTSSRSPFEGRRTYVDNAALAEGVMASLRWAFAHNHYLWSTCHPWNGKIINVRRDQHERDKFWCSVHRSSPYKMERNGRFGVVGYE